MGTVLVPVTTVVVAEQAVHTAVVLTKACVSHKAALQEDQLGDNYARQLQRWKEKEGSTWRQTQVTMNGVVTTPK